MEQSREREKEVEVKRMTDKIKNKCYLDIGGIYKTAGPNPIMKISSVILRNAAFKHHIVWLLRTF